MFHFLLIVNYYNDNKNTKYYEPERVLVRQIRVLDSDLADSLFYELEKHPSLFELFVEAEGCVAGIGPTVPVTLVGIFGAGH